MRRLFKLYRYILICMVLATLVLSFVAWYTVGVVELHGAIDEIDANISDMADTIDQNAENKTMLETELTDDYKSKTRVLAMLLDSSLTEESIDDKTLEELRSMDEKLQKSAEGKKGAIEPQADYLMEIVEGWALPDEFTRDNVIVLLKNYPRAFDSIGLAYTKELMGIREKN